MSFTETLLDNATPRRAQAPLILLAEDEPDARHAYRAILERGGTYRVLEAEDGLAALALARTHRPAVVISDLAMPGLDGFALCAQLKADAALDGTMFMILSGHGETERKTAGLLLGVDDYVTKPVQAGELLARTRALVRQKALSDALRAEHAELVAAKETLARGFTELLDLLGHLLDVARPGAGDRSARLATAAEAVGRRCDIPEQFLRELVVAGRLAPLAELSAAAPAGRADGDVAADTGTPWRQMIALAAVLGRTPQLAPIGELLNAIYENWDGTGSPGHAQKGQIPMRARILRVLLEYFALTDAGTAPREALERLQAQGGTRFDPAVVAIVGAWVRDGDAVPADRRFCAVEALEAGMTLADDLHTASGVLLLAAGAGITPATLGLIQKRHLVDPVVVGPYVRQPGR